MEYTGLIRKYSVNRPLTNQERKEQLHQKQRLDVDPAYQLSVIRMNSTFMEVVDKYFAWKGMPTMVGLIGAGMVFFMLIALPVTIMKEPGEMANAWPALLAIFVMAMPLLVFIWWGVSKESFAYTHYPIRLNRKTRMVHVFRTNGAVLSVPWDEVFFCIGKPASGVWANGVWEVQGHVLDKDGVTIRETFAFSQQGVGANDAELLKSFWEFNRRYMEEGSNAVSSYAEHLLPIARSKETFIFGFHRTHFWVGFAPLPLRVFILLIYVAYYPGRWFAMRTSRIPQWPKQIEDQCVIEPNDPYVREAGMNPDRV